MRGWPNRERASFIELSKSGQHNHKWTNEIDNESDGDGGVCNRIVGNPRHCYQRDDDVKTVETIEGKVLSIENSTPAKRRGFSVDLMLQTGNGIIPVQLGPAWYVDKPTLRIEANDTITVTGS